MIITKEARTVGTCRKENTVSSAGTAHHRSFSRESEVMLHAVARVELEVGGGVNAAVSE